MLAGGTANLRGMDTLFREGLETPVRVALPRGVEGLPREMQDPSYSAVVGALLWGTRQAISHRLARGAQNGHKGRHMSVVVNWLRERARRVAL
ncbi:Cell division protein FtsA [bacterium HR23]|nr:Cell division protein FtsA [bacterium HR23]